VLLRIRLKRGLGPPRLRVLFNHSVLTFKLSTQLIGQMYRLPL